MSDRLTEWLKNRNAERLGIDPDEVDVEEPKKLNEKGDVVGRFIRRRKKERDAETLNMRGQ